MIELVGKVCEISCYVTVEVVDANGQRVPDAEIPVRFSVSGAANLLRRAVAFRTNR